MSYEALYSRIRAIIEAEAGLARTIADGTFEGDVYVSMDDIAQSRRAIYKPRVEAQVIAAVPHKATPMANGDKRLDEVTVEVRLVQHLGLREKISSADRDTVKALAWERADDLIQSLTYQSNFDAGATGLVSGRLKWTGSALARAQLGDGEAGIYETVHTFTGIVNRAQAVS